MSSVTITLSDNEDGTVTQEVAYQDGFDGNSQSHHYSAIMLRMARDVVDAANRADQRMPKNDVGLVIVPANHGY